jgi:hypothetical protein
MTEDLIGAAGFLKSRPECTGKIGAVGFCFGGDVVNTLATRMPDLAASAFLWRSAERGRCREDQVADAAPLRGARRAHQRRLAGVRGGAEDERRQISDVHVRRGKPRLPQRYDTALRRGRRQAGLVAHDCIPQGKPKA